MINEETHNKIFQAMSGTKEPTDMGLGLFFVKETALGHG